MLIIIIKAILVIMSILTVGILPIVALINQWIWNNIIILYVIDCGIHISSFWIMLGLTTVGTGISVPYFFKGKKK